MKDYRMSQEQICFEIEELRNEFERLPIVEISFHTTVSSVFSRYPVRRIVPVAQSDECAIVGSWELGDGIELLPRRPRNESEASLAKTYFDVSGNPIETATGESLCFDPGIRFSFVLNVKGSEAERSRVIETLHRASRWAGTHWEILTGLLYPSTKVLNNSQLLWLDVVRRTSELVNSALLPAPKYFVQVSASQKIEIDTWKRREDYEQALKIPPEIEAAIGDDPEDYFSESTTLLADSLRVFDFLKRELCKTKSSKSSSTVELADEIDPPLEARSVAGIEIPTKVQLDEVFKFLNEHVMTMRLGFLHISQRAKADVTDSDSPRSSGPFGAIHKGETALSIHTETWGGFLKSVYTGNVQAGRFDATDVLALTYKVSLAVTWRCFEMIDSNPLKFGKPASEKERSPLGRVVRPASYDLDLWNSLTKLSECLYAEQGRLWRKCQVASNESQAVAQDTKTKTGQKRKPNQGDKKLQRKDLLRSVLLGHHGDGSEIKSDTALSFAEIIRKGGGRSKPTITRAFEDLDFNDYSHYVRICSDQKTLKLHLQRLDCKIPDEVKSNLQESIDAQKCYDDQEAVDRRIDG